MGDNLGDDLGEDFGEDFGKKLSDSLNKYLDDVKKYFTELDNYDYWMHSLYFLLWNSWNFADQEHGLYFPDINTSYCFTW